MLISSYIIYFINIFVNDGFDIFSCNQNTLTKIKAQTRRPSTRENVLYDFIKLNFSCKKIWCSIVANIIKGNSSI